jgi:hypothetical protein
MVDEYGAVGEMRIGSGNRSTRENTCPSALCPPQIPNYLTWGRTLATAVGNRAYNRLSYGTADSNGMQSNG